MLATREPANYIVNIIQKVKPNRKYRTNYRFLINSEFLPSRQTVDKDFYLSKMRHLHEGIHNRMAGLFAKKKFTRENYKSISILCPDS